MLEGYWLTTYLETQTNKRRHSQPGYIYSLPSGTLSSPRDTVPCCTNTSIAEPVRRTERSVHIVLLSSLMHCKYRNRPVPDSIQLFSVFKVFKCSLQHHKQLARCFGLSASSRKSNSGLLQPMVAPHYFSPCPDCPQSKVGTHASPDILEKACLYWYPVVWQWIATLCESVSRLSWVILHDSYSFSNAEHEGPIFLFFF